MPKRKTSPKKKRRRPHPSPDKGPSSRRGAAAASRSFSPQVIAREIQSLQQQLETAGEPQRLDCSPESVEQGLARLVLSLVEMLRKLLERQAIRRMEGGSLTSQEVERMGQALMRLEAKIHELAAAFGLRPEDLNLELGPLGRLHS